MSVQGIEQTDWAKSLLNSLGASSGASGADSSSASGKTSDVDFAKIIMAQFDADSDGQLSATELKAGGQKIQNSLSQLNGISSQMRACNCQGSSSSSSALASSIMSQLDANGDNSLDITESGMTQANFNAVDVNTDGKISLDELQAVADRAAGKNSDVKSASKLKAGQSDCKNMLAELQTKSLTVQYETLRTSLNAA